MKVEIYSDVVCPWCYIGERRFEKALGAFPGGDEVEVVFRPYQLQPDAPVAATPLSGWLAKKFGANVDRMLSRVSDAAAEEGITIDWDNALAVNTLTAHRLSWLAEREYGARLQRALVEALFHAHFSEGGDVGNHEALTRLAGSVGMDEARVREFLASDEGLTEVTQALDEARELGIAAVPTFVFDGKYAVQGGQPTSTFLEVLEEVQRR
jgi:predicted DsbA family dithiol-disulfide isomerase